MSSANRKNLIRFVVFTLVLVFLLSPFLASGELFRAKTVAQLQQYMGEDFLFGSAYSNNYSHYKFNVLKQRNAEVLAIGDSRILQIKGDFFTDKSKFYNAGLISSSLDAALNTLKNTPKEHLPKVLIFSFDQAYMTKGGTDSVRYFDEPSFLKKEDYHTLNMLIKPLFKDRSKGKFKFSDLYKNPKRIGVLAKMNGMGFKQDGSYYYENIYNSNKTTPERINADVNRIKEGRGWFAGGKHIYENAPTVLKQLCEFCKDNNIYLICYAPPFSKTAMDIYKNRSDSGFLKEIDSVLAPITSKYGFEFYNYTDPSVLQLTDEHFIDAFHGSDAAYLAMIIDMLRQGSKLKEYMDISYLQDMYKNRVSDLVLKQGM